MQDIESPSKSKRKRVAKGREHHVLAHGQPRDRAGVKAMPRKLSERHERRASSAKGDLPKECDSGNVHGAENASSPSPQQDPVIDMTDLWWSDEDITGHMLDLHDPLDDGEGINGIGFLPTSAAASTRIEKRRRQVQEWKERENREARIRRGARRTKQDIKAGVEIIKPGQGHMGEKVVRFAD